MLLAHVPDYFNALSSIAPCCRWRRARSPRGDRPHHGPQQAEEPEDQGREGGAAER